MVELILYTHWDNDEDKISSGWNGDGWYFWDETQAYCYGPFNSNLEASEALKCYASNL